MCLGFSCCFLNGPLNSREKSLLALLLLVVEIFTECYVAFKISMFTGLHRKSDWNSLEVLCCSLQNCVCHLRILLKAAPLINNLNIRHWAYSHKTAKFSVTFKFLMTATCLSHQKAHFSSILILSLFLCIWLYWNLKF